jgi:signal peptidase
VSRHLRRHAGNLVVLVLLGVWFVTLAPTAFGGPAAYIEVQGHSMDGTYATGDLVVTREHGTYAVGDVVAFRAGGGQVIHRITGGDGVRGYTLQGDNNPEPDPWHPTDVDVVGAAWLHLPQQAHLLQLPGEPWFAGLSAGLVTLLVLGWDARPRRRARPDDTTTPGSASDTEADAAVVDLTDAEHHAAVVDLTDAAAQVPR